MGKLNPQKVKYIVVHTTASNRKTKLTAATLRSWHKARGFRDIGYGEVVGQQGRMIKGRGIDQIGAHVAGFNTVSVGIAWEGGHNGYDMDKAQEVKLLERVKLALKMYPNAKVCGHRDLSPDGDKDGVVEPHEWTKMCPWFDAEVWAAKHGLPHTNFSGKAGGIPQPIPEAPDKRTMWLQNLLRLSGANIPADGFDGPKTSAAIEVFQTDNQLPKTGKFDKVTVARLRQLYDKKPETVTVTETVPAPIPEAVKDVVKDAAAKDRTSSTERAQWLQWLFGGGATTVLTTIGDKLPVWAFTGIAVVGVGAAGYYGWYILKERKRKRDEGAQALAAIDV